MLYSTDGFPPDLWLRLHPETYYWIGAIEYTAWLWTVDYSPLFTYAGFLPLWSVVGEPEGTVLDNSVWKCHLHCHPTHLVGMMGTKCYCLGDYNTINIRTPEDTCPGNLEERCGNIHGLSVYQSGNVNFYQNQGAHCAYVKRADTDLYVNTTECSNEMKCFSCFMGTATSIQCRPQKSWFDADDTCSLVKLYTSVQSRLLDFTSTFKSYWIGLHKYLHRRWTSGVQQTDVADGLAMAIGEMAFHYGGYQGSSSLHTWCLSVYKQWDGGTSFYWGPCTENRRFICEYDMVIMADPLPPRSSSSATTSTTVFPQVSATTSTTVTPLVSTTSTTVAPQVSATTSTTATPQSSLQPSPSSAESHPSGSAATTDNISSADVETPTTRRKHAREPSTKHTVEGGFCGLGALLVLTVLVVLYLLRRQKKLCFKQRDRNQAIPFTSGAEHITLGLNTHVQTESEADAVITHPDTTEGTSVSSTDPEAITRPSVHSDTICTSQIDDENGYNVLSTSNTSKVPVSREDPYKHLSGPDGGSKHEEDYDTENVGPQTEAVTTVTHPRLPDVSSGQIFEEEQYNVLGQHDSPTTVVVVAEVHDHVATDEVEYDTARWGNNASDDSYSHIQTTTKPRKKDLYDVTSKVQLERHAEDPNNHDVNVDDVRGGTTDYCNTGYPRPDSGCLDGHVGRDDQENVSSLGHF
ncbi:uncharacterized protein [Haliotis asinina]|uniref:uncharacterized protein n=1 Tax=Haliotis asinina TaxID=109174 RepID=UPI0035323806